MFTFDSDHELHMLVAEKDGWCIYFSYLWASLEFCYVLNEAEEENYHPFVSGFVSELLGKRKDIRVDVAFNNDYQMKPMESFQRYKANKDIKNEWNNVSDEVTKDIEDWFWETVEDDIRNHFSHRVVRYVGV